MKPTTNGIRPTVRLISKFIWRRNNFSYSGENMRRVVGLLIAFSGVLSAVPIPFDYQRLGSYRSEGLLSLQGIGTWNGQPLTDTNRPTDEMRKLAATTNFYASPSATNVLFLQLTEVTTTQSSYWFGTPF